MTKPFSKLVPVSFRSRLWLLFGGVGLMFIAAVAASQFLIDSAEQRLILGFGPVQTLSLVHARLALAKSIPLGLLAVTVFFGLPALVFLQRHFTRNLEALLEGGQRLQRCNLKTRLAENQDCEFGALILSFNRTAAVLQRSEDALLEAGSTLERRILERTEELQAANERLASEVAERKDIEERLSRSERSLRTLINSATDYAIFGLDLEGRVVSWNEGAHRMYGYPEEEILGESANLLHPGRAWVDGHLQKVLEAARLTGCSRTTGYRCRQDGSSFLAYYVIQPVLDQKGQLEGYCEITQDLTERQEAEEQLAKLERRLIHDQKLETVGTLAAGISHDFNNIIAVIMGHAELIRQQGAVPPDSLRSLEKVLAASGRAAELVKQIQRFCRNDKTEFGPVDLCQVVAETHSLLKGTLPSSMTVRLQMNVNHAIVHGNAGQLQQVLINLATNARDAMVNQAGVLTVLLDPEPPASGDSPSLPGLRRVRLSVSDNGCGMEPATVRRIFEPFFTTKPIGRGTGLGLAVAHSILQAHQAHCTVESELGRGTTFHIVFALVQGEPSSHQTRFFGSGQKLGRGECILMVDDEPDLLDTLGAILEHHGYRFVGAASARRALELLRQGQPPVDLLVTDKTMPEMDGLDLARQARELAPNLPVVLMSGLLGGFESDVHTHGLIHALLPKPIKAKNLVQTVSMLLAAKKTKAEHPVQPKHRLARQASPEALLLTP